MPKMKTRQVVSKRIRVTKTGKLKQKHVNTSHLRVKDSTNQTLRKKRLKDVAKGNVRRVKVALPYQI